MKDIVVETFECLCACKDITPNMHMYMNKQEHTYNWLKSLNMHSLKVLFGPNRLNPLIDYFC
jgi:hypothetical protein